MVKLEPQSYKIGNGDRGKDQRSRSLFVSFKVEFSPKECGCDILVLCLTILTSVHVFWGLE